MAVTKQNFFNPLPLIPPQSMIFTGAVAVTINAANVALGAVLQPEDVATHGNIVGLYVYCTAISSPVALSYRASLQPITARATGPTGTPFGGASPVSKMFTPSVGLQSLTFDNPYTPTMGTTFAAVIDSTGWVSGSATFNARWTPTKAPTTAWGIQQTVGTWSGSGSPCIAVVYADGYISRGCAVISGGANALTANVLYGNTFTPSINMGFYGINAMIRPATSAVLTAYLYEGTGTGTTGSLALKSTNTVSIDPAIGSVTQQFDIYIPMPFYELQAGTQYRVFYTANTNSTTSTYQSFPSRALLQVLSGDLTGCIATSGNIVEYNSGTDWRQLPVTPLISYMSYNSGGGVSASQKFTGLSS